MAPTGPFIGGFECNGTETSLLECRSHSLQSSCNMLAGVTCTGTSRKIVFFETHIKLNLENGVKLLAKVEVIKQLFCSYLLNNLIALFCSRFLHEWSRTTCAKLKWTEFFSSVL